MGASDGPQETKRRFSLKTAVTILIKFQYFMETSPNRTGVGGMFRKTTAGALGTQIVPQRLRAPTYVISVPTLLYRNNQFRFLGEAVKVNRI
jgi:hypothetical protein